MSYKTSILLVDDSPENLTALEATLEGLEQRLVKAHSAKEALKYLMQEEETFAVILLDVQMPEMDGYEAATLIRQREKSRLIPIIFLTALNRSDFHMAQGYSTGAVDYLFKPFDPEILKAKVAVFVELARKTRALEAEIERRQAAEKEIKEINRGLERRVQERTAHIEALNSRLRQVMSETHDRVRNNLQLLTAMIDMQMMEQTSSIPVTELRRLATHVRTFAVVHNLLAEQAQEDPASYQLSVPSLLQRVMALMKQEGDSPKLTLHVQEAHLPVRESTSLSLIANELSSNAIRHGIEEVEVAFTVEAPYARLQVCDDGPGFALDFHPQHAAQTGLHFVEDLTRHDLGGEVRYENRREGGARVTVTIPYRS